jgi:serine protease AprX
MRYAVISLGIPLSELERIVRREGGEEIRVLPHCRQLFADLPPEAVRRLSARPDLAVREAQSFSLQREQTRAAGGDAFPGQVVIPHQGISLAPLFEAFRNALSPPLTGQGTTIAVLDSGIRESHMSLRGKVVYSKNFSTSHTSSDIFDHGTGVAFLAAGEEGMAPGAFLMNIKVMDDRGEGNVEWLVAGIDEVIRLRNTVPPQDPAFPHMINLSLGTSDRGDPMEPSRVAVRAAIAAGLEVVAAVGNSGPSPFTVSSPAVEPLVIGVGAMTADPWDIWPSSSRGPTREGIIKPDVVFLGVGIRVASARGDDAFAVKSGTSFAAPAVAGLGALVQEWAVRFFGRTISQQEAQAFLPLVSAKPPTAPPGKDNAFGWGMPFADLFRKGLAPASLPFDLSQALSSILGLGLLTMVGTGMIRAVMGRERVE